MDISVLKAKIKSQDICAPFIFAGEEDYLKKYYLGEIKKRIVTDETFAPFNYVKLDGARVDFGMLLETVSAPPFMADFKLVEWHYPDLNSLKDKDIEAMETVCNACREGGFCTLVFIVGAEDLDLGYLPKKPSKLYKTLSDFCEIVTFDTSKGAELSEWVTRHFRSEGVTATRELSDLIISMAGHSMQILALEVDKLAAYVLSHGRSELAREDVELVCSKNFESDTFALSNAILEMDAEAAYADLRDKQVRRVDPLMVLASLTRLFCDLSVIGAMLAEGKTQKEIGTRLALHDFKCGLYIKAVKRMGSDRITLALDMCKRIETSAKTVGADSYNATQRLIAEIFSLRKQ